MKKIALFLIFTALSVAAVFVLKLTPMVRAASDEPQFKLLLNHDCSDGCFDVDYSWPGEGKEPIECTVTVKVTYSKTGNHGGGSDDFKMTHKIHNTGSGWAQFDGRSALDNVGLLDGSITSKSCE